jgi:hypothetical protein
MIQKPQKITDEGSDDFRPQVQSCVIRVACCHKQDSIPSIETRPGSSLSQLTMFMFSWPRSEAASYHSVLLDPVLNCVAERMDTNL